MSRLDSNGIPLGYAYRSDDETTPRELERMMRDVRDGTHDTVASAGPLVLDVRTSPEWDICRIAGAKLLPLQELDQRMDELKDDLNNDLTRRIVVNCHHGRRSLTATYMLRAAGFTNVTSLAGGIHLWAQDVDRAMPTY